MLSVVIVNHRSHGLVEDCLRALLLEGSLTPMDVVVVDNEATGRGLPEDLLASGRVRLLARKENPGYAASCNDGARLTAGSELLFLNADVTVTEDCVRRCHEALVGDPTVGVVTPRLVRPDGSLDHACHRGLPTPLASLAYSLRLDRLLPRSRRLGRYRMSWLDPETDHDVEAGSGAFLMLKRDALEAVGGWDERYRFYAEDLDLCLRIGRLGLRVRYLGSVTARHVKGAFSHRHTPDSHLDADERTVKQWVSREVARSHRLFFEEHLRARSTPPVRAAIELLFAIQEMRLDAADRRQA